MKKKPFDYKLISIVGGSIVGVTIIWGTITKVVDWSRWSDVTNAIAGEIQEVKGDVIDLKKYVETQQRANEIQARANELMQKQVQQQGQQQHVEWYLADDGYYYTKDGKFWWDEKIQQWIPVQK